MEYAGARALQKVCVLLPTDLAGSKVAPGLGSLAYLLLSRHRRRAQRNLEMVKGCALGFRERNLMVRLVFQHLCLLAYEFLAFPWMQPHNSPLVVSEESQPVHRRLCRLGGGIIFVTSHLGNWELLGAAAGRIGLPVHSVARPLDNPYLDRWLRKQREALGQRVHHRRNSTSALLKVLRKGGNIAYLADQYARRHKINLEFLGIPTSVTTAPALLSLRSGAPVVPVCAIRAPQARGRLRVYFSEPIHPDRSSSTESEVCRITAGYTRALEEWIRRYPSQWLWLHRRWRKSRKSRLLERESVEGGTVKMRPENVQDLCREYETLL